MVMEMITTIQQDGQLVGKLADPGVHPSQLLTRFPGLPDLFRTPTVSHVEEGIPEYIERSRLLCQGRVGLFVDVDQFEAAVE
ncbi:hypothetical protein D3C80_1977400 [compost metagenome]